MPRANIVYWYGLQGMPRDGGGLRALAWHRALTELGYETSVHGLRQFGTEAPGVSFLKGIKKRILPMPLQSGLPKLPTADLNVVTVPSVFASAARKLPMNTLVFDWMDVWSVNARTMATSSLSLLPGGLAQSLLWKALESHLPGRPAANAFAGHHDFQIMAGNRKTPSFWLPTPVELPESISTRKSTEIRRIGFLANMNYPPNTASLKKFLTKYSKHLEERKLQLIVAGYGSEVVSSWNDAITVLGPVQDVAEFYSMVDAVIVPIDHGGGIKVKAVEAMAHGIQTYGTGHVREGFSPSFWPYIGDVDALMNSGEGTVDAAPYDIMRTQFSNSSFKIGVEELLTRSGFSTS